MTYSLGIAFCHALTQVYMHVVIVSSDIGTHYVSISCVLMIMHIYILIYMYIYIYLYIYIYISICIRTHLPSFHNVKQEPSQCALALGVHLCLSPRLWRLGS